jgi:predicted phosphohydrolase
VTRWLRSLPHRHKVVIAGNHDFLVQEKSAEARPLFEGLTYLEDEEAVIDGVRIWGSPWQPWFHQWAFNLHRGADLDAKWKLIPEGIDVLVTHGPPAGMGDKCWDGRRVGCDDLLRHLGRVKPKVHLFGHIHEDRGEWPYGATRVINVTTSDCELPCTVIDVEV